MDEILKKLNLPVYLPQIAYRRNHKMYELVCAVNGLIGCRISGNLEGEELFKKRILMYMEKHTPSREVTEYYRSEF